MATEVLTYGDFQETPPTGEEYLVLAFSPSSRPLHERWRNNGLSADFLADYFVTFMPQDLSERRYREVKTAVAYIANELLENAMKFTRADSDQPISLSLNLAGEGLLFTLTNTLASEDRDRLTEFLEEFTGMDASEFMVTQLERNADTGEESGLGFATMVADHEAALGWRLEVGEPWDRLTTQVRIAL